MGDIVVNTEPSHSALLRMKNCLAKVNRFQLCALILSLIGWIMCVTTAGLDQWRVWHVSNSHGSTSVVWIGIWETCHINDSISIDDQQDDINCIRFRDEDTFLPSEIFVAQNLMAIATIAVAVGTGFISVALWNIAKKKKQDKRIFNLFLIGGIINITSGIGVFIPIVWTMISVLLETPILFPDHFNLPPKPKNQYVGAAIPVGMVSAFSQVMSGLFILGNKRLTGNKIPTMSTEEAERTSEMLHCRQCSSMLLLNIQDSRKYDSVAIETESHSQVRHINPSLPKSHIILVTPHSESSVRDEY